MKLDWGKKGGNIYIINKVDVFSALKPKQLQKLLQNNQDVKLFHGLQTNLSINF